jgi:GAF domain-containing protein
MAGWTRAAEASFVPLQAAVFCAQCELISGNNSPYCLRCGSRSLLSLSRVLGGSLLHQNTARLITDSEVDRLVRELIGSVPLVEEREEAGRSIADPFSPLPVAAKAQHAPGQGHLLLQKTDLDLGKLDLEPTISLFAERAQAVTAATGAAVALRRGHEIVCRARAGRTAPDLGVRLQTDSGISAECVRRGRALICGDAENHPQVDLASCRRLGVRSILVAPLRYFRRTLGLFEVLSSMPNAFDQRDVGAIQVLAGMMVAVISRRAGYSAGSRTA